MAYRNIIRQGTSTTTTRDPRMLMEDINDDIRTLRPEATPILTLSQYMPKGDKPKNHKVVQVQYHSYSHRDFASKLALGKDVNAMYERYAVMTLDAPTRPDVADQMFYQPQDKFFVAKTGQVVEVWMTPMDSISMSVDSRTRFEIDAAVTGGTTSRTAPGTVLVRSVLPEPIKPFTSSDLIFMGRSIYESQKIEAVGHMRDYIYDCNFVEHKERVISMSRDQKEWVKTHFKKPVWDFEQTETMEEFKRDIENTYMWGVRGVDMTIPSRPKRTMNGLFHTIETNVAYYNPFAMDSMEKVISTFCFEQAFRYNPNGNKKIAICGGRFLYNFNQAFKDTRRTSGLNPSDKKVGFDIDTYVLPGGFELKLIPSDAMLGRDMGHENWCFVIDPKEMELKPVLPISTRFYQAPEDRDVKLMMEWQGTVAWHREQSMALLRTV